MFVFVINSIDKSFAWPTQRLLACALKSGESRREVVIAAVDAATQTISVTLKADRRIRRAPDGAGGGYK